MTTLRIATYNIHKGFSQFNRRMVVHELRERLRAISADIVFLQEVQGMHLRHARKHPHWPEQPQHEFLAEDMWPATAYGGNAIYDHGHHGNAILSRYAILKSDNQDVSNSRLERRGLLHCEMEFNGAAHHLHCVCVHLSLTAASRRRQIGSLVERIEALVPNDALLIIAGDFNDWHNRADNLLAERLGLTEVFCGIQGHPARSFPSTLPVFRLDRIYVRGFAVASAEVHFGPPWSRISDHAALSAEILPVAGTASPARVAQTLYA
ncbi:MAG: endonuclease/exonuclease/phosphatase family protein [Rhodocyclaceae bacterium]|nr:endonuclease/exonuclease/phosphatase family protein [Rhodocyclaceae bacterium]